MIESAIDPPKTSECFMRHLEADESINCHSVKFNCCPNFESPILNSGMEIQYLRDLTKALFDIVDLPRKWSTIRFRAPLVLWPWPHSSDAKIWSRGSNNIGSQTCWHPFKPMIIYPFSSFWVMGHNNNNNHTNNTNKNNSNNNNNNNSNNSNNDTHHDITNKY